MYRSFISLVKLVPRYFFLLQLSVRLFFLISLAVSSLLAHRKGADFVYWFCTLKLYCIHLLSLILFCGVFRVIYMRTYICTDKQSCHLRMTLTLFPVWMLFISFYGLIALARKRLPPADLETVLEATESTESPDCQEMWSNCCRVEVCVPVCGDGVRGCVGRWQALISEENEDFLKLSS